jgi:hypothetical protein
MATSKQVLLIVLKFSAGNMNFCSYTPVSQIWVDSRFWIKCRDRIETDRVDSGDTIGQLIGRGHNSGGMTPGSHIRQPDYIHSQLRLLKIHAYKMHACKVHAYKMHAYKVHACKVHARKIYFIVMHLTGACLINVYFISVHFISVQYIL